MRQFVAARGRADRAAMQESWGLLLTEGWERLEKFVYFAGVKMLSATERDEALSNAAMRLTRKAVWNFNGTSVGEFVSYLNAVAKIACLDEQRNAARYSEGHKPLDPRWPGDDEDGEWSAAPYEAREAKRKLAEAEEAESEREALAFGRGFLDWALPRLSPGQRAVIELLRHGRSPAEIMQELDMSRASVDQNKKRGLDKLIKLKEQYES